MSKILLGSLVLVSGLSAWGQNFKIYVTLNPAGDFIAESNMVTGQATEDEKGLIEASGVKVDVKSLKTGISLRDDHMQNKYLESAKFPSLELKIAKGKDGKGQAIVIGKGKQVKVSGTYEKIDGGKKIKVTFPTKVSDYGISDINYKGIGVEDEVKVELILPLTRKVAAAAQPKK